MTLEKNGLFDAFVHESQVTKTLNFRLIPDERTEKFIAERGLVQEDERLADDAFRAKRMMDDVHRAFIDRVLEESAESLIADFEGIAARMRDVAAAKDAKERALAHEALADAKAAAREKIAEAFRSDDAFGELFGAKMRKKTMIEALEGDEESREMFRGFAGLDSALFVQYDTARALLYASGGEVGSVAARIIDDNLPRHLANVEAWAKILEGFPELARDVESELSEAIGGIPDMTAGGFARCVSQKGIEHMNSFIGGVSPEDGAMLRGVNMFASECSQKTGEAVPRMVPLYRQILSDRTFALSFLPQSIESDAEAFAALDALRGALSEKRIFAVVSSLVEGADLRPCGIYVAANRIQDLSARLFGGGRWKVVGDALDAAATGGYGDEFQPTASMSKKERAAWRKKPAFEWAEISAACSLAQNPARTAVLAEKIRASAARAEAAYPEFELVRDRLEDEGKPFVQSPKAVAAAKAYLDALLDALRVARLFECSADEARDGQFYAVYDAMLDVAADIVPVYNRIRDYATRRAYSTRKFRLHFGIPSIGAGWDVNKEASNGMILLRRDGEYHVGIAHNSARKLLKSIPPAVDGEQAWEKMSYRQARSGAMALPKSYICAKAAVARLEGERPDILRIYREGTFKKNLANGKPNPAFSVVDARALVDWYKQCIAHDPNMDVFGFKFSPTATYENIGDFYREFDAQAYSVRFENVSAEFVEEMVESGNLYLFRVWSRHMGKGVHGSGSMPLHWWNLVFSPENVDRKVFKLMGGVELFYRRASITDPIVHRKGSALVNRTVVDPETGIRRRLPDRVYHDIYKWKNAMIDESAMSDEAREAWAAGGIVVKEAPYDIVKDRRFSEDRYMMAVRISINRLRGKAPHPVVFNDRVLSAAASDGDLRIVGINRGERNLVYAVVIDRAGRILEQRALNVMDGIDWRERLDGIERRRRQERRDWKTVEAMATTKDAYIGRVVREIVDMMVRHRAMVVIEDLSSDFRNSRAKFEKNVYAKLEGRLADKLSYLASKPVYVDPWESGGAALGYQLALPSETVGVSPGRQNGFILYASPWKISAIDPATGFVCLFGLHEEKEREARDFFSRFRSIRYAPDKGWFEFSWDYADFDSVRVSGGKGSWTACTHGGARAVPVCVRDGGRRFWKARDIDVDAEVRAAFDDAGIDYSGGGDLRAAILESKSKALARRLMSSFRVLMRMRYSAPYELDPEKDYVLSPVAGPDGTFFDSRTAPATLPRTGDANDAYHIALKGLQMLTEDVGMTHSGEYAYLKYPKNPSGRWLDFAQAIADSRE